MGYVCIYICIHNQQYDNWGVSRTGPFTSEPSRNPRNSHGDEEVEDLAVECSIADDVD